MSTLRIVLVAAAILVAACAGAPAGSESPTPSPTPSPTATPPARSQAELKYALLDEFGPISWCDPDFYPIPREDEQAAATERWPAIIADRVTFVTIAENLGLDPSADLTAVERLAVYRDWKLLNAVRLEPVNGGSGGYSFDLITETDPGHGRGIHTSGVIDAAGAITVESQEESFLTACPICLARGTLIDTPNGGVAVDQLHVGDPIWTVDAAGARIAATVLRIGSTPVPPTHRVVHLVLDDGRELHVSPGHRLADGRAVGSLVVGDLVDGARVATADPQPYAGGATFDVLPSGPTGDYWAGGILLSSTLD
jgi:hypothetical protein